MNPTVPAPDSQGEAIDWSVVQMWRLEPGYLDPPQWAPEHEWLLRTAADYGIQADVVRAVLYELSLGWSVRTAFQRASVPSQDWNRAAELIQRLIHAGILVRSGHA